MDLRANGSHFGKRDLRFCGLTRQAQTTILPVEQPHWVYRYDSWPGSWTPILSNLSNKDQESPTHRNEEPIARYAHQVVYNPRTKTAYLHGGNAGVIGVPDSVDELATPTPQNTGREKRLSDLWELKFQRYIYTLSQVANFPLHFLDQNMRKSSDGLNSGFAVNSVLSSLLWSC